MENACSPATELCNLDTRERFHNFFDIAMKHHQINITDRIAHHVRKRTRPFSLGIAGAMGQYPHRQLVRYTRPHGGTETSVWTWGFVHCFRANIWREKPLLQVAGVTRVRVKRPKRPASPLITLARSWMPAIRVASSSLRAAASRTQESLVR